LKDRVGGLKESDLLIVDKLLLSQGILIEKIELKALIEILQDHLYQIEEANLMLDYVVLFLKNSDLENAQKIALQLPEYSSIVSSKEASYPFNHPVSAVLSIFKHFNISKNQQIWAEAVLFMELWIRDKRCSEAALKQLDKVIYFYLSKKNSELNIEEIENHFQFCKAIVKRIATTEGKEAIKKLIEHKLYCDLPLDGIDKKEINQALFELFCRLVEFKTPIALNAALEVVNRSIKFFDGDENILINCCKIFMLNAKAFPREPLPWELVDIKKVPTLLGKLFQIMRKIKPKNGKTVNQLIQAYKELYRAIMEVLNTIENDRLKAYEEWIKDPDNSHLNEKDPLWKYIRYEAGYIKLAGFVALAVYENDPSFDQYLKLLKEIMPWIAKRVASSEDDFLTKAVLEFLTVFPVTKVEQLKKEMDAFGRYLKLLKEYKLEDKYYLQIEEEGKKRFEIEANNVSEEGKNKAKKGCVIL
jgi:hypothetical protein